jgi:hypothetical protein
LIIRKLTERGRNEKKVEKDTEKERRNKQTKKRQRRKILKQQGIQSTYEKLKVSYSVVGKYVVYDGVSWKK